MQPSNQMMMHPQTQTGLPPYPNSPQRRFLSEGELLARTGNNGLSIGTELSLNRNNNTVDNIRELAGSPQRGVYNWKDNSPPGYNNSSQVGSGMYGAVPLQQPPNNNNFTGRPPLPTQQQQQYIQNQNIIVANSQQQQPNVRQSNVSNIINNIVANSANSSNYHPAIRGGVQVFPPNVTQIPASPQVKRKQTPTRPISFVRALEMSNSIEMTNTNYQQGQQQGDQIDVSKPGSEKTQQIVDRGSIYDTNYEISV